MAILETWRNLAYGDGLDDKKREELWTGYFSIEKGIYEQILSNPTEVITGTVKELAEKYNTELLIMTGFLDGINESLKGYQNPIDTMEEDTEVRIEIDPEKLYYNMVEAKADWLYELPQWDAIREKSTSWAKSKETSCISRSATCSVMKLPSSGNLVRCWRSGTTIRNWFCIKKALSGGTMKVSRR